MDIMSIEQVRPALARSRVLSTASLQTRHRVRPASCRDQAISRPRPVIAKKEVSRLITALTVCFSSALAVVVVVLGAAGAPAPGAARAAGASPQFPEPATA
jgi:hypothetical protein